MKMTDAFWKQTKFFKLSEAWGDPYQMEVDLLLYLDKFRKRLGIPFIIHCGYATIGHVPQSEHYKGNAVDGHAKGIDLLDLFLIAEWAGFTGIGVYDYGLHVDLRDSQRSRWCRIDGVYMPLTSQRMDTLRDFYKYK